MTEPLYIFVRRMVRKYEIECADDHQILTWYQSFTDSERASLEADRIEKKRDITTVRHDPFDVFCDDARDEWCHLQANHGRCSRIRRRGSYGKSLHDQELEEKSRSKI